MSKQKNEINPKDVKAIVSEYRLNEDDFLNLTDEELKLKKAINQLCTSDFVMFCLYSELASERALSRLLGISRTPISKELKRIKAEIKKYLEDDDNT